MYKILFSTIISYLLVSAVPAIASELTTKIIDEARKECNSFEDGILELEDGAVSNIDITGDGKLNEIIDSGKLSCSSARSLFCGTGGCTVHLVTDLSSTEFLAKGWKIVNWYEQPIVLLAVHGSECGGNNLRRCYQALVWSEDKFRAFGDS